LNGGHGVKEGKLNHKKGKETGLPPGVVGKRLGNFGSFGEGETNGKGKA